MKQIYDSGLKLDFDDVLIVPTFSDITSRSEVDLQTITVGKHGAVIHGVPIIAANMDGVGTFSMNRSLSKHDVFTAIVKHTPFEVWEEELLSLQKHNNYKAINRLFITLGMSDDGLKKCTHIINFIKKNINGNFVPKIVLDVANGYMNKFSSFIYKVRQTHPDAFIMAGTVTTPEGVKRMLQCGADVARVGIGTGAVCTTRRVAGVGYPIFSALQECVEAADEVGGLIQSDGGCVYPGDFAKAFGVGANFVMAGSIFAGHTESETNIYDDNTVPFYGMSSHIAQKKYGIQHNYRASEGRIVKIPYKGSVENTILEILGGIRSACTYVGAKNLEELPKKCNFIRVNNILNRSLEQYTVK